MPDLVEEQSVDLERLLSVLIFLQLDQSCQSMTEKVEKLSEAGLGPAEIGRIVGKPSNYIAATLSRGKKRKRKGKQ